MVDRPKLEPREPRSLSIDETRRFIAAAADDRYEALWIVLLTLRPAHRRGAGPKLG